MNLAEIVNSTYTEKATKEVAKYWLNQVANEISLNTHKIVTMVCGESYDDTVTFKLDELDELRMRHHALHTLRTRLLYDPQVVENYEIAIVLGNVDEEDVHRMSVKIARDHLPNTNTTTVINNPTIDCDVAVETVAANISEWLSRKPTFK